MKMIAVVALALVAIAAAAPTEEPATILRALFEQQPEGGYISNSETSDGIKRQETGELKEILNEDNKPQAVIVVRGSYTYTDSNGKTETVNYEADQNGYRAFGPSIPVAPVVPVV